MLRCAYVTHAWQIHCVPVVHASHSHGATWRRKTNGSDSPRDLTPCAPSPGTSYSKEPLMAALQATSRCPHCGCSMAQLKAIKNAMLRKVSG